MRRLLGFALLLCVVTMPLGAQSSQDPVHGKFDGCPVGGENSSGGPARDPVLNTLKNRSTQDDNNVYIYQVAELMNTVPVPSDNALKIARKKWSHADRAIVKPYEGTEAEVTGYLYDARAEGPEQPNCGAPINSGDYHVWLMDNSDTDRTVAAVVEVTPRWRDVNQAWDIATLKQLAHDKTQVRITGWLLFDQEHPEQVGNTRGTLWELHPITKIEELDSSGQWQEL